MYREYLPPDHLKDWVVCYWTSVADFSASFRPVYPDGCADIIFNFGGAIVNKTGCHEYTNSHSSFVVGTMTRTLLTRAEESIELLGIRFQPGTLFVLSRIPQKELRDGSYSLAEMNQRLFGPLRDQLHFKTTSERIALLNNWLAAQLLTMDVDKKRLQLLKKVFSEECYGKVHELSRESGFSVRQLERLFQEYVGVSPKEYLLICRFIAVKQKLARERSESLLEVAVDYGFHDHAHLTHVFKRFTGISPSEFLSPP